MNDLLQKTIGQMLQQAATASPEAPAFLGQGQRCTYGELHRLSDRAAAALLGQGIRRGMHIGIRGDDTLRQFVLYYAVWKLGAVLVPLNPAQTAEDLSHAAEAARLDVLLIGSRYEEAEDTAWQSLPASLRVIPLRTEAEWQRFLQQAECCTEAALAAVQAAVSPQDEDTILFTSGTTGRPKPVITTHFSRVNTMRAQAAALHATAKDVFCSALPSFHCFNLTGTVLAALAVGAAVCLPQDRHGHSILQAIEQYRCTVLLAVPTMFSLLLHRKAERAYDLSSLRVGMIGGSHHSTELYDAICRELGLVLLPSLGQTEATAGVTSTTPDDTEAVRRHTIGRFLPLTEGSIRSPQGEALPPNTVGEICLRGYNVMQGYYEMPEATAEVIDAEGWLHTGDLGSMDEQGYVTYRGRLKELIIRAGENISPQELEEILLEDERIAAVKVIGIPDPHYTEEVCACVVARKAITAEAVQQCIRRRTAAYKVPRYVVFLASLPTGASGKVKLEELREQIRPYLK